MVGVGVGVLVGDRVCDGLGVDVEVLSGRKVPQPRSSRRRPPQSNKRIRLKGSEDLRFIGDIEDIRCIERAE